MSFLIIYKVSLIVILRKYIYFFSKIFQNAVFNIHLLFFLFFLFELNTIVDMKNDYYLNFFDYLRTIFVNYGIF